MTRNKLHTIYTNSEGKRLPGVSTLKGQLGWSKEKLMGWVKKVTLKGLDYNEVRRSGGGAGSLVHLFASDFFRGLAIKTDDKIKTNTDEFTKNEINLAENAFISFLEWSKDKLFRHVTYIEQPFISEIYQFGGTPDLYCDYKEKDDDKWKLTLLDWKSGSGIFLEDLVQVVGGYTLLLEENKFPVNQVILLNIPKSEDDSFLPVNIDNKDDIKACQEIIIACKDIYDRKKIIRKIGGVR